MSIDVDLTVYINVVVTFLCDDFLRNRRELRGTDHLNRSLLDKPVGCAGADFHTRDVT
jgi:hypothetical protein